jgi:hypothetical protein
MMTESQMTMWDVLGLITTPCLVLAVLFFLLTACRRRRSGKAARLALGIRCVLLSDTHMDHAALSDILPAGDVLIHAGDFTTMGRDGQAEQFNSWLGEMKIRRGFQHIFVVNGNHEYVCANSLETSPKIRYLEVYFTGTMHRGNLGLRLFCQMQHFSRTTR